MLEVEQEEHNRTQLIGRQVRQLMHHPNTDALIADLHSSHPFNPFSEELKQINHTIRNVKCFELSVLIA